MCLWRQEGALLWNDAQMPFLVDCRAHLEVGSGDAVGQVLDQQHSLAALHAGLEATGCMATCLGSCLKGCHVSAGIYQGCLGEGDDVSLPQGHAHWQVCTHRPGSATPRSACNHAGCICCEPGVTST